MAKDGKSGKGNRDGESGTKKPKKEKSAATAKRGTSGRARTAPALLSELPPHGDDASLWRVVIETSKGSPNKLGYDEALGAFTLHHVLPQGMVFPFDFGFIPSTRAGDGDPIDVLVLTEAPLPPGTVVETRLVGVIEAEERERGDQGDEGDGAGEVVRNDRLIGVTPKAELYSTVGELSDLPDGVVAQIEHFFVSYEEQRGKAFSVLGRQGSQHAAALATRALRG